MNMGGINYSPDFKAPREQKLLSVPLAGEMDVGKLQVIPKRDVDAALSTSKQLTEVVVKLARDVKELAEDSPKTDALINRLEEIEARLDRIEKRLDEWR